MHEDQARCGDGIELGEREMREFVNVAGDSGALEVDGRQSG